MNGYIGKASCVAWLPFYWFHVVFIVRARSAEDKVTMKAYVAEKLHMLIRNA